MPSKLLELIVILSICYRYQILLYYFDLSKILGILVLPKISLNQRINILSGKEFNNYSGKLFLIFLIISLTFVLPTYFIFSFQVYFIENSKEFYKFIKPFFDFCSFFISYLNYTMVFAALSYSYKKINN